MRFLSTMQLQVQLFAGTDVADAAADLCELANRVGTLCEAEFNGVHLWARPGDDPAHLVAAWGEQMKRPAHVYKIAQARNAPGVLVPDGGQQPHTYGPAICEDCGHRWMAVWPLDAEALECPKCRSANTDREQVQTKDPNLCREPGCMKPTKTPVSAWCREHDRRGAIEHG